MSYPSYLNKDPKELNLTQFFYTDGPREKFGLETLLTDEQLEAIYSDVDYDEE